MATGFLNTLYELAEKGSHPELVEGSVRLPFIFTEAELILRQAQDDCLF
jgi:hypothetical protein